MEALKVAVVGASGYSGEELIRLLLGHPGAHISCVTSRQHAGRKLTEVFPRFAHYPRAESVVFSESSVEAVVNSGSQAVFLALPHGLAAEFARPLLAAGLRVLDLSADFRLRDPLIYKEFYGTDHPAQELLSCAVYGLPELHREKIKDAKLIACPGCYPTSILVPLHPLLKAKLLDPASIRVSSASGVSGAGRKAETPYLFAECNESFRAYGVPKHRHLSEIEQELSDAAGNPVRIAFIPHLTPLTRGIHTTMFAMPAPGVSPERVAEAYAASYAGEPFIRVLQPPSLPDTKMVTGTNFVDLSWRHDPRTGALILFSAEDNLTKGAAGQGIQCLNIISGWPETLGLLPGTC
jgi:N-acetyl-gamma-glutamyl-phosphate reductase